MESLSTLAVSILCVRVVCTMRINDCHCSIFYGLSISSLILPNPNQIEANPPINMATVPSLPLNTYAVQPLNRFFKISYKKPPKPIIVGWMS
jgi:hypothetical protein